ncbi:hypothetical protein Q5P01_019565 [Channa striata]|uniref:Uncharacterized protein n=1 Tax=Channa striata TaxID=64152 RepID=A0AA88M1A9_CHASR|nr:hypothetical protein Q5P01_019565 [Channa striata]
MWKLNLSLRGGQSLEVLIGCEFQLKAFSQPLETAAYTDCGDTIPRGTVINTDVPYHTWPQSVRSIIT